MARFSKIAISITLVLLIAAAAVGGRALVRQQATIGSLRHSMTQLETRLSATDTRASNADSHFNAALSRDAQQRGQVAAISSLLGSTPVLPDLSSAVTALQTEYQSLANMPAAAPVVVTSGFATVQQLATVEQLTSCLQSDMNQLANLPTGDINFLLELSSNLTVC